MSALRRPTWAAIDVDAIAHNAALLKRVVSPSELCAVIKADGYGHGAIDVARAAIAGGATVLAVALVDEGIVLREAGIDAPILVLSEPNAEAMRDGLFAGLTPTVYTEAGVDAAREVARELERVVAVHLKVDTGMHRVGADLDEFLAIARRIWESSELDLEGFWTHFAVADDLGDTFSELQLQRFVAARELLSDAGITPRLFHAANTAGAIGLPDSRLDWVRCGLALYGYLPSESVRRSFGAQVPGEALVPAMSLHSRVELVRRLEKGERPGYGRIYPLKEDGLVAAVPLGYADGLPWPFGRLSAPVLVNGKRRRIAGQVSMDQVLIDIEDDAGVLVGDEVVFFGRQGNEEITAADWADLLGTIPYEVLCRIGPRVPRVIVHGQA